MPPKLNPGESKEAATVRWLTQLLAALVHQSKDGKLLVKKNSLSADHEGQDLVESRGENGHIILRLDSTRHIAIYSLRPWEDQRDQKTSPNPQTAAPSPLPESTPSQISMFPSSMPSSPAPQTGVTAPGVQPPKNGYELKRMEELLKKQQLANRIVARQRDEAQKKVQELIEQVEIQKP